MAGYRPGGTGGGTGPIPPSGYNPRDAMVHELYARQLRQPPTSNPGVTNAMADINNPPPGSAIPPPPPGLPPQLPAGIGDPNTAVAAAGAPPMAPGGQLPQGMQPTGQFPPLLQPPAQGPAAGPGSMGLPPRPGGY